MKTLIPQNLTHRGTVRAAGFWFSAKLLAEDEMRRRILALWQADAKVYRYGEDLILLLPQPFPVAAPRAAGLPLVKYGAIISSFPLRQSDLPHFQNLGDAIVRLAAGKIETIATRDLQTERIEDWFDSNAFRIVKTATLGEVKTKPVVIEKTETVDLRESLKQVPQANAEMAEILKVLKNKKDEIARANRNPMSSSAASSGSLTSSFGGILDAFKSLFAAKSENGWGVSDQQPKPPGKLRQALTKALFQMKIAQIVGRKQAAYLAKMMEMFENGDLEEALKHAIPLEDMRSLKEMSEQMPFLGFLRPRDNLRIDYGRQRASGSAVHLENQWFDDLRELYRRSFDRLVAQNRIEEAAFVLAELLKNSHEAVEFLEKHGKYRLAAELAEARDLPKEVIVRQWFLAGERRRAIQLAVLHNSFEYAVTKLETENHPRAAELREIWAENLAQSGNFAAAVGTIWKLENRRARAADWIEQAIEFGGARAAEMLAKKIALFPETFAAVKTKLLEILAETGAEAEEKRAAFARETLRLAPNPELRALARPLARKILADAADGFRRFTAQDFRQLIEATGDYALRTDLPKLHEIPAAKNAETLNFHIAERDTGASRVCDALLLPDGKIAVALGEAGVKILSKKAVTIAHFDQPTEKFIRSDSGTRAICLARRGEIYRLAKIDFAAKKAVYWCDAKIGNHAPTYDGNLWFISEKSDVYAIDANAKDFEAVWRVADLGGTIYQIARAKNKLMLAVADDKGFETWWYELPQFILRRRNRPKWFQMENENQTIHSVGSFVAHSVVLIAEASEERRKFEARIYDYDAQTAKIQFSNETVHVAQPQIVEQTFALASAVENAVVVDLHCISQLHIARFVLENCENFSFALDENLLTITDQAGRIVVFDHREKLLRADLRV